MQYQGGKTNLFQRHKWLDFWRSQLEGCTRFVDVMCGSGAVSVAVKRAFPRLEVVCNDAHPAVVPLLRAVGEGWQPPGTLDENEYNRVRREVPTSDPLHGFAAFGCSFGGKYFGGFARGAEGRNYAKSARAALLKDASVLSQLAFSQVDYAALPQTLGVKPGDLWYVDKPYTGTAGYKGLPPFDDPRFWIWAAAFPGRLLVSDFIAPDGWRPVYQVPRKVDISGGTNGGRAAPQIDTVFERLAYGEVGRRACRAR